jgi:hypothetical protein
MRKLLVLTSLSVLASMLTLGIGPAWALPIARGTGSCKIVSGVGGFDKQITKGGTASVTKVKISFKIDPNKDCTVTLRSPSGDVVTGVESIVGSGVYERAGGFADSCTNIAGGDTAVVKVKVQWIATTAIATTRATFGTGASSPSGSSSVLTYSGEIAWAGSFTTSAAAGKLVLATSIPTPAACTTTTKFDSFTIDGSYIQV